MFSFGVSAVQFNFPEFRDYETLALYVRNPSPSEMM
jgi:hypothetical protein